MESSQLNETTRSQIEELVRALLKSMSHDTAVVESSLVTDEAHTSVSIQIEAGDDGRHLIGPNGAALRALQHVVRSMVRKQVQVDCRVVLDVNQYRDRRAQNLQGLAEAMARRAASQGRTIVMRPMQAADRRLVHTALAERVDVKTESLGEEPNRRVVVKPVFM